MNIGQIQRLQSAVSSEGDNAAFLSCKSKLTYYCFTTPAVIYHLYIYHSRRNSIHIATSRTSMLQEKGEMGVYQLKEEGPGLIRLSRDHPIE